MQKLYVPSPNSIRNGILMTADCQCCHPSSVAGTLGSSFAVGWPPENIENVITHIHNNYLRP